MATTSADIGSLANELGVGKLVPNELAVVSEMALREAVNLVSRHGLKAKEIYERGQAIPHVLGDFYLNFGPYILRARIPRESIPIEKPLCYKALNESSH